MKTFSEHLRGKGRLENLEMCGRMKLYLIIKKQRVSAECDWIRPGPVSVSCKHGN
jgi:hypothetical protein